MQIEVNQDKLTLTQEEQEVINSGAIDYYELNITFDSSWDSLTKKAILVSKNQESEPISVINNKILINAKDFGSHTIGLVGYRINYILTTDTSIDANKKYYTRSETEGNYVYTEVTNPVISDISTYYEAEKDYQISTNLESIYINRGAGEIECEEHEAPSPSEWDIYIAQIQAMCNQSYTKNETDTLLEGKVDKEDGKGLSSNDYTIEEKDKLAGIENNANNYVLPNTVVQDNNYVHTDNNYTTQEKDKLAGLENYDDTEIKEDIEDLYDQIPERTANGTTIHLTDSSDLQLKNVEIQGNSTQEVTPTLENEVPISVVTGDVFVKNCGNNLLNEEQAKIFTNYDKYGENPSIGYWSFKLQLKPNTYYSYCREDSSGIDTGVYCIINTNRTSSSLGNWIIHSINNALNAQFGVIRTDGSGVLLISIAYSQQNTQLLVDNVWSVIKKLMIVEGQYTIDTMLEYAQYQEQSVTIPLGDIELCSLPNGERDRIYKSNNKWWLEKKINNLILTDNNTFYVGDGAVANSTNKYFTEISSMNTGMPGTYVLCNYLTQKRIWDVDTIGMTYEGSSIDRSIRFRLPFNTVEELKTWLASNNAKVQYQLKTPIITEITDAALITALEQLLALRTYKHITNIENDKNAYLDITYRIDLNSLDNNDEIVNYNNVQNKPSINGIPLVGNKTAINLGLAQTSDINTHNASDLAHADIRQTANEAKAIARGKAESRTFNTTADLIAWISNIDNKNVLKIGDNLYDKTSGVPDYWISAVLEESNEDGYYYDISPLDSEVPDISNMATTDTAQIIGGNKNFTGELKQNGVNVQKETIEDVENFFSSNTVEGALQELGEIVDFTKNKASDLIWQEGYYGVSDGVIASNAYICSSNYINVKPFDNYKFYNYTEDKSVYEQTNIIAMLADDDNNKIGLVVRRASASQVPMFIADEWTAQYARFMIPAEATRMYLNVYAPTERQNYASNVGVFKVGNLNVNVNVTNSEEFHNLEGKKWTSFGDSITYQNVWQPLLIAKYRVNHVNCGIGGSCLAGNTPNAFWQNVRLNAVKVSNPDFLTILGGANDLGDPNIEIGTEAEFTKALANKDKMTFLGAYSYIIENLLTWKPSLRIVILGTTWAHMNGADYSQTLTYSDFSNASKKVAEYYGLPFIDLHGNCGFNKFTMEDSPYNIYSNDHIHPNSAGAKMIAEQVDVVFKTMFEFD